MIQLNRIAVLPSGGDAPGMNAAIRAIVIAAHHYKIEIIGFFHGYNGLIENESTLLGLSNVNDIIQKGGTLLKSARCPAMQTETGLKQATNTLIKENIDALIVIGGDGSFRGLLALKDHWNGLTIGLPGTIDNDIDGTDLTIGFSTAVNTAIEAVDKIRDTANAFERVFIVELMGRNSGHITFNVGIACAAEQVLSFENIETTKGVFDQKKQLQKLVKDIKLAQTNRHNSYLIVSAENLWPGGAAQLAIELQQTEIDATPCILGHIQRGGSPVAKDRILATKMGVAAIQYLLTGQSNLMIGEQNNHICTTPLEEAIKQTKTVSQGLIEAQQNILALTAQHEC
jgi:6-phosphofructokinase 1